MIGALSLFPAGSLACLTAEYLYNLVILQPTRCRRLLLESLALIVSCYGLDTVPAQTEIWRCGVSSRYSYTSSTTTLDLPTTV